jgi:hypothetical protein
MIGFNLLGNLGRLGNQMFQYASLRGIAANNGYDWCIPPHDTFGNLDVNVKSSDTTIYKCFNLHSAKNFKLIDGDSVDELFFHFDDDLFNNCRDNISLSGYYQSEKYFKNIEDDIRKDFTFKTDILTLAEQFVSQLGSTDIISLHIRRGDYLKYSHHPTQNLEYYSESLKQFDCNLPVIIFSDDSNWVKSQELFSSDRFLISENNTTEFDLCLMSLCSYAIIANSSFSWWGAWLAKSKKTVSPKNWFGPPLTHDTKNLYCDHWITL